MLKRFSPDEVIEFQAPPIDLFQVERFKKATNSKFSNLIPPTFPTTLRTTEFDWLDRLGISFLDLLSTAQEYEYLLPLAVGDVPIIRTRVAEFSERKSGNSTLTVFILASEITCAGTLKVRARATFLVRKSAKIA
jgi:hypothetical protein